MTGKPVAEQLIFIFQGDFCTFKITNNFGRFSYNLDTHFKEQLRNRNILLLKLKLFVFIVIMSDFVWPKRKVFGDF